MDVRIRHAIPSDEPAIAALDRATWAEDNNPNPAPVEDPGPRAAPAVAPPRTMLVAEGEAPAGADAGAGGSLLGYIALRRPHPIPASAHVREINGLAVDPAARRLGVGRALVQAAIAEARAQGAARLTLRVLSVNAPARALYASCGFEVEGVLRGEFRLGGRSVDDVLMALGLD